METRRILLLIISSIFTIHSVFSQIDSVIVEKYYISDANDATDITGGGLPVGSITYRIFIDLANGSKLLKVYGDADHAFRITSTEPFFNNIDRGRSFGREIRANRLNENTNVLDTWITIGMSSDSHFGVLKADDTDGSVIGGLHNDGGSASISGGLLVNNDPVAGIPIVTEDGLIPAVNPPGNLVAQIKGVNISSTNDTSVFGSISQGREFLSNDFFISSSAFSGKTPTNRILIAQLTTKGELSFSLNVIIEETTANGLITVSYVAVNPDGDEKTNRFLTYPVPPPPQPVCGCKDPDYLEYNKDLLCHIKDSCKNKIIYGCTDPNACNFNSKANYNVQSICCYPGRCNDRDIRVVCSGIFGSTIGFEIYPNPAHELINLKVTNGSLEKARCVIYDSGGTPVLVEDIGSFADSYQLNISSLSKGYYIMRIFTVDQTVSKTFIKR
jgi:hypothetical protein